MILIPIGHEQSEVRRLPWVTFGLMIACALAFVATGFGKPNQRAGELLQRAVDYFVEHPYLELDPRLEAMIFQGADEQTRQGFLEVARQYSAKPESALELTTQQERLDEMIEHGLSAIDEHPFFRFGLVPDSITAAGLVGHMFLHGGWMHLLGNLLILFLVGPFVEDVWGRPLFAAFYVGSGILAGLCWVAQHPDLHTPLIGASGAIAGVMGAFFVRHFRARLRFFYMFGLLIRGTFLAPAWIMLPLWFLEQVFMAMMVSDLPGGGGVAYWAHIGGFVGGALFALGIRHARVEEKYIRSAIDRRVTVIDNSVIEQAQSLRQAGDPAEAFRLLAQAHASDPANCDVALSLWDVATEQGWAEQAAPAMIRCVEAELRAGETAGAVQHWYELLGAAPRTIPAAALCLKMARSLQGEGRRDWTLDALRRALAGSGPVPPATAIQAAQLASGIDPALARQAAELALRAPQLHPEERRAATALLEQLAQPVVPGGVLPGV